MYSAIKISTGLGAKKFLYFKSGYEQRMVQRWLFVHSVPTNT